MRQVNRITPALPISAMQTYAASAPPATHWRRATCEEVDCQHYMHGWATTVAAGGEDEALIRRAGRRFNVERQPDGFLRFAFPPGQPCFRAGTHRVPLEREPLYVVRSGDWRGGGAVIRRHVRGQDWVEDFATHQDAVARRIGQG